MAYNGDMHTLDSTTGRSINDALLWSRQAGSKKKKRSTWDRPKLIVVLVVCAGTTTFLEWASIALPRLFQIERLTLLDL
jgi:hypothetical protein